MCFFPQHVRKMEAASHRERQPRQPKQMVYDPFKLIPCLTFTDEKPVSLLSIISQPFTRSVVLRVHVLVSFV